MKSARKRIRPHAVGVALCGALLAAACETDNVTDLTEDRPVLKMAIAPGDAVYPSGSVELSKAVVSGFDLSVPDDGFDAGYRAREAFFADPSSPRLVPFTAVDLSATQYAIRPRIKRLPALLREFGSATLGTATSACSN